MRKIATIFVFGICSLLCSALLADQLDDSEPKIETIEGKWLAIAEESGGKRLAKSEVKKSEKSLEIKDGQFSITWSGKILKGRYEILADEKPSAIDMSCKLPNGKSGVMRGIYELEDKNLRICYSIYIVNGEEVERPEEFETEEGTNHVCVTYVRQE